MKRRIYLVAGPLSALLVGKLAVLVPGHPEVSWMAGVTLWMAIWWMSEVVHLAVTSLIPVVFLPLLGIADAKTVSFQYMDQVIFLFIGGFILAIAIERHGLHKRVALSILSHLGKSPGTILAGVMLTAYLLSMWISNTATVMMLITAIMALISEISGHMTDKDSRKLGAAVLIGLAYSATIGGMATLVGTPPNMVFYRVFTETYPDHHGMDFLQWFRLGLPLSAAMMIVTYYLLRTMLLRGMRNDRFDRRHFRGLYQQLGRRSSDQNKVLMVFVATVLLWFTRGEIGMGDYHFPGWAALFHSSEFIQDSTVAVAMALLLFLIPSGENRGEALLTWNDVGKLPFDIILLFGSGFALAKGFEVSGLSQWLAGRLTMLQGAPLWLIVLMIGLVVCIISEFASNVASIQLVLPVLVSFQMVLKVDPLLLMVPATFAASLGFMLPVATAPNTIVFGTGKIKVREMMLAGWWLDLAGILLITAFVWLVYGT